jgi:protein-L-isoaspartate(D-aspartate) O-methyltransferase
VEELINNLRKIKREDFVVDELKSESDVNAPLPIGYGQTISQPLTVAFMLELLQPQSGDIILDIGSGSGWQTALLAYCVGKTGKIIGIELLSDLAEFGKRNIAKYNFISKGTVEIVFGDGSKGFLREAPFDKIISAASARKLPEEWKKQLMVGGRLVAPIKESIWLFVKKSDKDFEETEFPGFAFVPLIEG